MGKSKQNRREFVKKSSLGFLGISVLPSLHTKFRASDRIRIAHIGVGGMGNNHMKWFSEIPEVEIVALCDVDQNHLQKSLKTLKSLPNDHNAGGYEDFRRIIERKDVDAISCATPDHWHAQIAALAFEAGKDVYGEKPLSYDLREGQMMLAAQQKNKRVFQLGTQIHATDNYHRVVELIKAGTIGKVHTVRLWKTGDTPLIKDTKVKRVPKSLNWDMWLGPAPLVDYIPAKCHFTYRYFMDYSGGIFADFWCHIADVVYWALEPKGLKKIKAKGEVADGIANTPKWIDVDYEFEDLKILWTSKPPDVPGASERAIGAYFVGEKGTLICDYNTREITIDGEKLKDIDSVVQTIPRSPGHQQNFIDAVKSREQPESNLEYARNMTLPMHLGLISWRLKRELSWDSQKEEFVNDEEANKLLFRTPRNKWNLNNF
ncbi:Gfo/Idh/MocA family protein [Eudoraea chungangensis]|uniref:Gfo/Idh/MocA family protein n=1 Tax=Eudoraea chungangensis TaxID=1481905 RepID=UPI0023EDFDDD|nr:Gfo/Idh/MocA family oxidoreductase [Eudoraea chungangensis]